MTKNITPISKGKLINLNKFIKQYFNESPLKEGIVMGYGKDDKPVLILVHPPTKARIINLLNLLKENVDNL